MCIACRTSRRGFLRGAGAALVGGWAATRSASARPVEGERLSPDQALERLKAGNARFVSDAQACEAGLSGQRRKVASGQTPWATMLCCADSRVPPELLFGGVGLGELFVARNAGNIADVDVLGTIEYGAEHLGSPLVVVVGHQRCGAVSAACDVVAKHVKLPGHIRPMIAQIVPAAVAVRKAQGDFVTNAVRENARLNARKVLRASKIVDHLVHEGKVKVVPAYYDLDSGKVEFLA